MGDDDIHEVSPLLVNFGKTRVHFNQEGEAPVRKTSLKRETPPYAGYHAERFYFKDNEMFKRLLQIYNEQQKVQDEVSTTKQSLGPLECAGRVKVTMQMCSRCGDAGKDSSRYDRYYVYKDEVAQARTILCKGCVGAEVKKLS